MNGFIQLFILAAAVSALSGAPASAQAPTGDYSEEIKGTAQSTPMIWIDGGELVISSYIPREHDPREEPSKKVTVDGFWIGQYEVRYDEFDAWQEDMSNASTPLAKRLAELNGVHGLCHALLDQRKDRANRPATGMNHWSAKRFCHWLSIRTGRFYRLPTEAEWELACRGGGAPRDHFPWGDDPRRLDEFAVVGAGDEGARCGLIAQRSPNRYGIFDMLGNVEEWVADGFDERRIGLTTPKNPVVWPVSSRLSGVREELQHEMLARRQHFVDNFGVAKGGSGLAGRPRDWRAFTVAARSNPTAYDSGDTIAATQDQPRAMSYEMAPAIGFRIARPATIPDRQIQLWHWGLYAAGDQWLDTTLDP